MGFPSKTMERSYLQQVKRVCHAGRETTCASSKPEWVVDWTLRLDVLVLGWSFCHDLLGIALASNTVELSVGTAKVGRCSKRADGPVYEFPACRLLATPRASTVVGAQIWLRRGLGNKSCASGYTRDTGELTFPASIHIASRFIHWPLLAMLQLKYCSRSSILALPASVRTLIRPQAIYSGRRHYAEG